MRRQGKTVRIAAAAGAILATIAADAAGAVAGDPHPLGSDQIGQTVTGATVLPDNQVVSPIGERIEVTNGRMISSALSPDGTKPAARSLDRAAWRGGPQ